MLLQASPIITDPDSAAGRMGFLTGFWPGRGFHNRRFSILLPSGARIELPRADSASVFKPQFERNPPADPGDADQISDDFISSLAYSMDQGGRGLFPLARRCLPWYSPFWKDMADPFPLPLQSVSFPSSKGLAPVPGWPVHLDNYSFLSIIWKRDQSESVDGEK